MGDCYHFSGECDLGAFSVHCKDDPFASDKSELVIYIDWDDASRVVVVTPDGLDHKVEFKDHG